jgi:hypothetical protein
VETTRFPVTWCEATREGDSKKVVKTEKVAVIGSYGESVRVMGAGGISGIGVGDRMASRDKTCI